MKTIKKYTLWFFTLSIGFVLLMTAVYLIPNSALAVRQKNSIEFVEKEGMYPTVIFDAPAAQLDNYTDRLMLSKNMVEPGYNAFQAAMYVNNYARYWHGYQVFLRPLLTVFTYQQIRYLNMFVQFLLLCLAFSMLHWKAGWKPALVFLLSVVCIYFTLVPASLQFSSVFIIMFSAIICLLRFHATAKFKSAPLFFMIIGMLTNFFDLLTAPLLTLGIPLLIYLYLEINVGTPPWVQCLKKLFFCSFAWTAGYGLCWLSKWMIASAALQQNVIKDAISSILFRTGGNEQYQTNRSETLRINFETMFLSQGRRVFAVLCLLLLCLLFLLIVFHRKKGWLPASCFLLVALYPYIWYLVLSNHSQIHHWFTYRIQTITLFGVFLFFIERIDWNRCRLSLRKLLRHPAKS